MAISFPEFLLSFQWLTDYLPSSFIEQFGMSISRYSSPNDAFQHAPTEKLLYTTCARVQSKMPDYLATVDVDPESPTYCQIIHRTELKYAGDEIHHSGWNTCVSCPHRSRTHLILPCLGSSRIYVVDCVTDPRKPIITHIVEPSDMKKWNVTYPHTSHCTPDGNVLISCLGDRNGDARGSFIVLDGKSWTISKQWSQTDVPMGYDYWYQPKHNVMVSSEWGSPNALKHGLDLKDVENGKYGHTLHVWNWNEHTLLRDIVLDPTDGCMPLEVRFMHNPNSVHGYVGAGLGSSIYHFYRSDTGEWKADKVISVKPKDVKGWALPSMPGVITDITISMDDKYLYMSCWIHGDVRQYNIQDPFRPILTGQVFLGGSICNDSSITVTRDDELKYQPSPCIVKGRRIEGGSQMLQLSLDGKRLYSTPSLYTPWDKQFYPELVKTGATIVLLDVDHENGGMKLNPDFLVDFGKEPGGAIMAHEMRYPGGDCSSDIYLAQPTSKM